MTFDMHAEFARFWEGASLVHQRTCLNRRLEVYQSRPGASRAPSYIVIIYDGERFEGRLALSPEGSTPRVDGVLISRDHESYRVRRDSFVGESREIADLACQLLDYEYKFPPEAGVTADNFVWTKKPPPYRP